MEENKIKQYNVKGFLLPNSIKSMAAYHAKIMSDGKYLFMLHDCINGVRLTGDLNDHEDVQEAVEKLNCLSLCSRLFANFIYENYVIDKKI